MTEARLAVGRAEAVLASVLKQNEDRLALHAQQVEKRAVAEAAAATARAVARDSDERFRCEVDCLDLLRGFRDKIFDEVLEATGAEATEILAGLPNAQHITLEFRSEREKSDGDAEQKIRAVAFVHGVERELEEAVSGGQFTSVSLAVDLALSRVVGRRLGCSLNWLGLDEVFHGHDAVTKQACLEMLQRYASDRLVVIVDHSSEVKEMFTQDITVVLENGVSRFA